MGTKQIRLSSTEQIQTRIQEFKGKTINIVLHNGNVFMGQLKTNSETGITLLNMRLKKTFLSWTEISELYFDTQA